jgi:uncharacterized protein YjbJ (UPF0337 family)
MGAAPCPSARAARPREEKTVMNWDTISGKWRELSGQLRSKWGKLTDDDLATIGGKKDVLIGRLQQHYGYQRDRAEREVDDYLRTL